MMTDVLFILAGILATYAYVGYPFLLLLLPKRIPVPSCQDVAFPALTVLIPARNEEAIIGKTLVSLLDVDYPHEALSVVVVSDASTDDTEKIVNSFDTKIVHLERIESQVGKYAAIQRVLPKCRSDIIILADSSSIFDKHSLQNLVRHFGNPCIGAVTGSKRILATNSTVSAGDGLYWRYDAWLRKMETRAGSSWVGVEGGFFGIRRELLVLDFPQEIAADYAIGCKIYEQGYLHIYEPEARVFEPPSFGMKQEFSRKTRVIVRGIKSLFYYKHLLNPFRHTFFSFQNISHRLMRWLVPFFLIVLLAVSGISNSTWIHTTFYIQSAFYLIATVGGIFRPTGNYARIVNIPWYFTVVNISALVSWFLLWRDYTVWKPTRRSGLT